MMLLHIFFIPSRVEVIRCILNSDWRLCAVFLPNSYKLTAAARSYKLSQTRVIPNLLTIGMLVHFQQMLAFLKVIHDTKKLDALSLLYLPMVTD